MELQLRDRLVAVTGAGAGIGRATAIALAESGAALVLGSRTRERVEETAQLAGSAGAPDVHAIVADLSTTAGIAVLSEAVSKADRPLHGVVCCVGATPIGSFAEIDDTAWQQAFEMKFLATVRAIRVAESMMAGRGGRIVAVAGNAARTAPIGMVTSAAINAALDALVGSAGRDLAARGIGLVGVHPGPTATGRYERLVADRARRDGCDTATADAAVRAQIADGEPARAEDVASLIAYLVSPRAAHLVASCVTFDGGQR